MADGTVVTSESFLLKRLEEIEGAGATTRAVGK
jgi:hypothetical protein